MTDVRIDDQQTRYDDYLTVETADISFRSADGAMSPPHRLTRVRRDDAACVLLIDRDARSLLLVEQFRWPTFEKGPGWLTEIVAGVIEPGESAEEAARREALEEAGVLTGSLERIAACYASPGYSTERAIIFAGEIRPGAPAGAGGGADKGEETRPVRVPFDAVQDRLASGAIADAKTLIALQWFVLRHAATATF